MTDFVKIAITRPEPYPYGLVLNEAKRINSILENEEADFVHIRKPDSSFEILKELISEIDSKFYRRLKLHDHFSLLDSFELGGIHLNRRNPIPYQEAKSVSKSIHTLEEIEEAKSFDYFFISPIFDSISKPGYKAYFDLKDLARRIKGTNAIALGGITPDKLPYLKSLGFKGAAMLSYYFPNE